jgi:hypothetical protein
MQEYPNLSQLIQNLPKLSRLMKTLFELFRRHTWAFPADVKFFCSIPANAKPSLAIPTNAKIFLSYPTNVKTFPSLPDDAKSPKVCRLKLKLFQLMQRLTNYPAGAKFSAELSRLGLPKLSRLMQGLHKVSRPMQVLLNYPGWWKPGQVSQLIKTFPEPFSADAKSYSELFWLTKSDEIRSSYPGTLPVFSSIVISFCLVT